MNIKLGLMTKCYWLILYGAAFLSHFLAPWRCALCRYPSFTQSAHSGACNLPPFIKLAQNAQTNSCWLTSLTCAQLISYGPRKSAIAFTMRGFFCTTYSFSSAVFYLSFTTLGYYLLVELSLFISLTVNFLPCSHIALDRRPGLWLPRSLGSVGPQLI